MKQHGEMLHHCYKNASRKIKQSNFIIHSLLPANHTRLVCDFSVCLKQIVIEGNVVRSMQYTVVLSQDDREPGNPNPKDERNNEAECFLKQTNKEINKQTGSTQLGDKC